jgi:hypothetical protein
MMFITPADYTVFAENVPGNHSEEELKKKIEKYYKGVKVVYINYCYNVSNMVKVLAEQAQYFRLKAIYMNEREKFLIANPHVT